MRCLHSVVNGKAIRDRATRRVDVQMDGLHRVLRLEEKELSHHAAGDGSVDGGMETDDAVFEQAGVNIISTLPCSLYRTR